MGRLSRSFSPSKLALLLTLLLLAYFLFNAAGNAVQNYQLRRERAQLEQEIARLQQRHEQLLALEAYLRSDEYVETVARRVLGYSRPGESTAIVTTPGSPQRSQPIRSPDDAWWESLFAR